MAFPPFLTGFPPHPLVEQQHGSVYAREKIIESIDIEREREKLKDNLGYKLKYETVAMSR